MREGREARQLGCGRAQAGEAPVRVYVCVVPCVSGCGRPRMVVVRVVVRSCFLPASCYAPQRERRDPFSRGRARAHPRTTGAAHANGNERSLDKGGWTSSIDVGCGCSKSESGKQGVNNFASASLSTFARSLGRRSDARHAWFPDLEARGRGMVGNNGPSMNERALISQNS